MKTYDAVLDNHECIFDSGEFKTAESVVEWASGRGGSYLLHVGIGVSMGLDFSTRDGENWAHYTLWDGWEDLTKSEVIELIRSL